MSLLTELNAILPPLLPVETGVFSDTPPDRYAVVTPLADAFDLHADNKPGVDIQSARIRRTDTWITREAPSFRSAELIMK